MKASENPYIQKYVSEVCFPIDYAEVKLGRLINDKNDNRFEDTNAVNSLHTRALVRTDRHPNVNSLENILLDVHSKGRAIENMKILIRMSLIEWGIKY